MKNFLIRSFVCALFFSTSVLFAQNIALGDVKVDSIPSNVDEFVKLRDSISTTPQGGAAAFLVALKMYADNPSEGIKAIIVALDQSRLSKGNGKNNYKGYQVGGSETFLLGQIDKGKHIPNTYFDSSSPENGYTVSAPYTMQFFSGKYSGDPATGKTKVFVQCSGADSRRPISVAKNDKGIWKVTEFSSVVVGVKKPASTTSDDL